MISRTNFLHEKQGKSGILFCINFFYLIFNKASVPEGLNNLQLDL